MKAPLVARRAHRGRWWSRFALPTLVSRSEHCNEIEGHLLGNPTPVSRLANQIAAI